jgi:uncharacterized membrane protein YfcA
MCALLGIGGGELAGPLFVSMQLLPQVIAGTTSMFSMYSSSASVVGSLVSEPLNYSTAVVILAIGVCGGITGRLVSSQIVKKYGRPSLTIFALVTCLSLSVCAMIYTLIAYKPDWMTHSLCK